MGYSSSVLRENITVKWKSKDENQWPNKKREKEQQIKLRENIRAVIRDKGKNSFKKKKSIIEHRSVNFFCKRTKGKYFRPCGLHDPSPLFNSAIVVQNQAQTIHKWMDLAVFQ